MKHITYKISEKPYESNTLDMYFHDMRGGVLDIESTGLNPQRNHFILGGLYIPSEGVLHQFLAETKSEEEETLNAYMQLVEKLDMVVTYNGRHFDLPFLEKRWQMYSDEPPTIPYNLDLYLLLNGYSPVKRFVPNLKQKTVENYMGLWQNRRDEISGGDSADLYNAYERAPDPYLEETILLHNSDDVMQLSRMLLITAKCEFDKAMSHLGFPVGPLTVNKIRTDRNMLIVSGQQRCCRIDYRGFSFNGMPVESRFSSANGDFYIKIPLIRRQGLAIVDLVAAGLEEGKLSKYPGCSSGFLVVEQNSCKQYRELNDFIIRFIHLFLTETGLV